MFLKIKMHPDVKQVTCTLEITKESTKNKKKQRKKKKKTEVDLQDQQGLRSTAML